MTHPETAKDAARAALDKARAAYVKASATQGAPDRLDDATRAAYAHYTRAAGRYAISLSEAGRDPRAVEGLHDMGAGALIGHSGASKARRAAAQADLSARVAPDRVEIKYRAPLDPKVYGYGPRIDPGGHIYSIFRDGRRIASGSGADLETVKAHALRLAAEKGLGVPPVFVQAPPNPL